MSRRTYHVLQITQFSSPDYAGHEMHLVDKSVLAKQMKFTCERNVMMVTEIHDKWGEDESSMSLVYQETKNVPASYSGEHELLMKIKRFLYLCQYTWVYVYDKEQKIYEKERVIMHVIN